jgi:hypothetical protein
LEIGAWFVNRCAQTMNSESPAGTAAAVVIARVALFVVLALAATTSYGVPIEMNQATRQRGGATRKPPRKSRRLLYPFAG